MTTLLDAMLAVEDRVRAAVARRRSGETGSDARFRGLYVTDDDVDRLLDGPAPQPFPPGSIAAAGVDSGDGLDERLADLARAFGLGSFDVDALLIALAPDLDARFERLYGYLQDDVTRRRATVGLVLDLTGEGPLSPFRARFAADGPLVRHQLVSVEADRPFLTRAVTVPDRVAEHLLGRDVAPREVADLLHPTTAAPGPLADLIASGLREGAQLVYIRDERGGAGREAAIAAAGALGLGAVVLDLGALTPGADVAAAAASAEREARLRLACLVAGPVDALDAAGVRAFASIGWPTVLVGHRRWDPAWSSRPLLLLTGRALRLSERDALWRTALDGSVDGLLDLERVTAGFRFAPSQVWRAAQGARLQARAESRSVDGVDVRVHALALNGAGLEILARRIAPRVGWPDLVLPPSVLDQLQLLADRARLGERVLGEWGMGKTGRPASGLVALFAGPSGVGKTMAAEVLAADLGVDLYTVDLATVVDKYIGETEKHLERIFAEAEQVSGVVFFDEADAIFGKRSEVRDARDRYANIEVAYLLQRLETFEGVAVLATNLRSNVDEAFSRRLDVVVDFPEPDRELRRRLWDVCLGARIPRDDDIDLDFLARSFELSGGHIRNICVAAAFLAARRDRPVSMTDLVRATREEYRKLGRLCVEAEFGPWLEVVTT